MRVVGGSARGRRLVAPDGEITRPTSDRAREGIFNMVMSRVNLAGIDVLDLFAGSGAMGIEALSRGANRAVFVETERAAIKAITDNLESLGFSAAAQVVNSDALTWLASGAAAPAGVAFVDPPYAFDAWSALGDLVRADLVVAESDRLVDLGPGWAVLTERRYGGTVVTLASPSRKVGS